MRVFMFFINTIFWLWLFIVPTAILGFVGFWLYTKEPSNLPYSIMIAIVGVAAGIAFAEKVRKHYGLDNFFGRLHASPDIDDTNISKEDIQRDDKKSKKLK